MRAFTLLSIAIMLFLTSGAFAQDPRLPNGVGIFVQDIPKYTDEQLVDAIWALGCKTVFLRVNEGESPLFHQFRLVKLIPRLADKGITVYFYGENKGDDEEVELIQSWVATFGVSGYVVWIDPALVGSPKVSTFLDKLKATSFPGKFIGGVIPVHPEMNPNFPYGKVMLASRFIMPDHSLTSNKDQVEDSMEAWKKWLGSGAGLPVPTVIPLGFYVDGKGLLNNSPSEFQKQYHGQSQVRSVAYYDLDATRKHPELVKEIASAVVSFPSVGIGKAASSDSSASATDPPPHKDTSAKESTTGSDETRKQPKGEEEGNKKSDPEEEKSSNKGATLRVLGGVAVLVIIAIVLKRYGPGLLKRLREWWAYRHPEILPPE